MLRRGKATPSPVAARDDVAEPVVQVQEQGALAARSSFTDTSSVDLLLTDPVTGRTTGLAHTVRRALRALRAARIPFCVVGATALAVRGLPRMTGDLDVAVMIGNARRAISALRSAGLQSEMPTSVLKNPEPMIVFVDPVTGVEVDLLCASGDPEATVIDEAPSAKVFGATAPVATLEHLLLLYLYSNQPKHLGDFARIVQSSRANLAAVQQTLEVIHPEMVPVLRRRIARARSPRPAPPKPPRRPR